jgi:hypothetical protein
MQRMSISTFVWGAVAGGIAVALALFGTGWAVTGMWAKENTRATAEMAVTESLARICVAQFEVAADRNEKRAAMMALDAWRREGYVSEQGWATMPAGDFSTSKIAKICAQKLAKMES